MNSFGIHRFWKRWIPGGRTFPEQPGKAGRDARVDDGYEAEGAQPGSQTTPPDAPTSALGRPRLGFESYATDERAAKASALVAPRVSRKAAIVAAALLDPPGYLKPLYLKYASSPALLTRAIQTGLFTEDFGRLIAKVRQMEDPVLGGESSETAIFSLIKHLEGKAWKHARKPWTGSPAFKDPDLQALALTLVGDLRAGQFRRSPHFKALQRTMEEYQLELVVQQWAECRDLPPPQIAEFNRPLHPLDRGRAREAERVRVAARKLKAFIDEQEGVPPTPREICEGASEQIQRGASASPVMLKLLSAADWDAEWPTPFLTVSFSDLSFITNPSFPKYPKLEKLRGLVFHRFGILADEEEFSLGGADSVLRLLADDEDPPWAHRFNALVDLWELEKQIYVDTVPNFTEDNRGHLAWIDAQGLHIRHASLTNLKPKVPRKGVQKLADLLTSTESLLTIYELILGHTEGRG